MPREALALFDMTKEYTIVALQLCTFQAEQSLSTRVFSWLIVLGILPKNGGCAAAEHLSGGDSPLGMAAPSGRRKVREIYSLKNCCQAGQFKFFLLMVLGKLTKSGSCAATEHLSGGDSPLGMLGLSRRRKGRDTGGRNCSIAGTVLCFFLLELRFYVTRVQ